MRVWCALGVVLGLLVGWDAVAFADVVGPPPEDCPEGTMEASTHAGPVCWARECTGENAVTCNAPQSCQPRSYCIRDVVDDRDNHYPDAVGLCDAQGQCGDDYERCFPGDTCIVECETLELCVEGTATGGTGGTLGTAGFAGLAGECPWAQWAGSAGLAGTTGVVVAAGTAGVVVDAGPVATGGSASGGTAPTSGGGSHATAGSAFVSGSGGTPSGGTSSLPASGGTKNATGGRTANTGATGGRSASGGSGTAPPASTTGGSVGEASDVTKPPADERESDDSGCGCRLRAPQPPSWSAALLLTAVLVRGRRRKSGSGR